MPKVKERAGRLKNPKCFNNYKAEEKFVDIIESRKILEEKGFQFPQQLLGNSYNLCYCNKARLVRFLHSPKKPCATNCQRILLQHATSGTKNRPCKESSSPLNFKGNQCFL